MANKTNQRSKPQYKLGNALNQDCLAIQRIRSFNILLIYSNPGSSIPTRQIIL